MIVAGQRLPILIATKPVDFRCGHNALALIVQTELKLDPHSGVTVVFRSKRGDRLKILVWDGTGMVLIYKVLEQGSFAWPKIQDGVMRLSRGVCQTSCPPISCSVSDFRAADIGFWIKPDGSSRLPIAGFA
jgi:transposase